MNKDIHNEEKLKRKKRVHSNSNNQSQKSVEVEQMGDVPIKKKRRKSKLTGKIITAAVISSLMIFAAFLGIYAAKIYTTPYSSIVSEFAFDTLEHVQINKEKCNILIMGTDKEGLRTDVMMLAQIDPKNNSATVMSIPRDTMIRYAGKNRKITEVHAVGMSRGEYGSEAAIKAVKELLGMPIHHFVKINFQAFRDSIDELGGVDYNVPRRMKYTDPYQDLYIDLYPGMQHLDGDKAEQLVRFRRYPNGDLDRIKVQQDFLHALAEQKLQMKYIGKIDDIYSIVIKNMETSMSPANFVDCGTELLDIGTANIKTVTMPGTPKDISGGSYVIVDKKALQELVETSFGYDAEGNEI